MPPAARYARFGPFEVDHELRILRHQGRRTDVRPRPLHVLLSLLSTPGQTVTRADLISSAWEGDDRGHDSLEKAVRALREVIGQKVDGVTAITTVYGTGYRFDAPVQWSDQPLAPAAGTSAAASGRAGEALDDRRDPVRDAFETHAAFITGRAWLESLSRSEIDRAWQVFDRLVREHPDEPRAHTGFAMATLLRFEGRRAEASPDLASLRDAQQSALHACRHGGHPDAWSTLALVLNRLGMAMDALAAAREATGHRQADWWHGLVLAFIASGAERLDAALKVLNDTTHNAFAHWLATTGYLGRQATEKALAHLVAGCALQDRQRTHPAAPGTPHVVGLHWLHGLVLAAVGDRRRAEAELACELEFDLTDHLFANEVRASTHYAIGMLALTAGEFERAHNGFAAAVEWLPHHLPSHAALAVLRAHVSMAAAGPATNTASLTNESWRQLPPALGHDPVALAMAHAVPLALAQQHRAGAAGVMQALVARTVPGPGAAWQVLVEPGIRVVAHADAWSETLAYIHRRSL